MRTAIVAGLALAMAAACGTVAARPAHHVAAGGATVLHIASHLAEPAHVTVDGKPITVPGYGSTVTPLAAGHHLLKVTSEHGVSYQEAVDVKAGDLMTWHGKGYWCINLLESALQHYSRDECQEDVTDAG
ncbi:hypothetical protein ACO2Q3_07780 [Caulobacter sp. KR2-114]|uniref:hypothetical protein n=1 Tax=Caulobacter sp. KR2-114 TaxID=3400912 RepID=UPI003BFC1971